MTFSRLSPFMQFHLVGFQNAGCLVSGLNPPRDVNSVREELELESA